MTVVSASDLGGGVVPTLMERSVNAGASPMLVRATLAPDSLLIIDMLL